ncbi:globin family protein [methanotrophic endosymbiont of Bathymodiolus puteoserpentis (Logatchev)]|jgi:hemoglobin-like flavoprotein|uniref:globin family protein n=1 Tax=methanotrophic endosymbiont of Bathymodiolus puteoserpentis (Logatchev) TaxID=343235 RepID=UPI0013C70B25|nr:globin family protein [methanotrophic endosymbiont of Bathymodiolus puteoserpentis (Logatchev)]SHE19538.1 Putative bacterial haemoglobin [methanotrophic endosymbiont of Bathymodiolus puteoserpentis (Logatchev)]
MMYGILFVVIGLACLLLVQNIKKQRQNQLQYIQEAPSPLSADQIRLIQESWQRILPIKEQAAELFYARLFELDPSVKKLFKGKLDYQGDKLMTTLDVVVNSLDNLGEVEAMLQAMGKRHIIYGVEVAHFETVGAALLSALEQGLGEYFTEEVKEAWAIAYGLIADTMKQAAYSS